MPDSFDYTTGTNSENVRLLQALIDEAPEYTEETNSRNANILKSIINNTEYTDAPQSEIEELLLRLKAKIGGEIEVDELNVTENGTYDAGVNKAYNPVNVELPLDSKTITENGTYTASDDNLAGYDEVTVAVEGYAKKSIANTPTPIATFNASALPMPSLSVGIEAVQAGNGAPSPTNVRPISGWSAVNVNRSGINLLGGTALVDAIHASMPSATVDTTDETISFNGSTDTSANKVISGSVVFKPNTQYTFINIGTTGAKGNFRWLYTDDTYDTAVDVVIGAYVSKANKSVKALIKINNSNQSTVLKYNTCGIFEGAITTDDFVAYSGTTYTTQLKDGQGNPFVCYGGQLVNENGVQRLDDSGLAIDMGSLNWKYQETNDIFYATINGMKTYSVTDTFDAMCEIYKRGTINQIPNDGEFTFYADSSIIRVKDTSYQANVTAFIAGVNGKKVLLERLTPQQIPQDNLPIATQDGTNNLWADSGDIQSGEYMEAL